MEIVKKHIILPTQACAKQTDINLKVNRENLSKQHSMKRNRNSNRIVPAYQTFSGLSHTELLNITNAAVARLNPNNMFKQACISCEETHFQKDLRTLTMLEYTSLYDHDPINCRCAICKNITFITQVYPNRELMVCSKCYRDLRAHKYPKFSETNALNFGPIPIELCELTIVEEQLISRYRLKCCIIKLAFRGKENSAICQRALRGNVIAFPHNTSGIGKHLRILPDIETFATTVKVILIGTKKDDTIRGRMKPWLGVRAVVVLNALRWKQLNDPLYNDILIQSESIGRLPDDDVPDSIWNDIADNIQEDLSSRSTYIQEPILDDSLSQSTDLINSIGYVDQTGATISPYQVMHHGLENLALRIPHEDIPASEYDDEYWYSCFPTLFPYGRGGPSDIQREHKVSLQAWIRHCLTLDDDRFRKHPSFMFIAYNISIRHTFNSRAKFRCKSSTFETISRAITSVKPEDLRSIAEMYKKGESATKSPQILLLLKELSFISAPIDGTPFSKLYRRNEIRAVITKCGPPTLWFTLNPCDVGNPLVPILAGKSHQEALSMNSFERMKLVVENPVAAAEFFHKSVEAFLEMLMKGLFGPCKEYYGVVEAQGRGSLHIHFLIWLEQSLTSEIYHQLLKDHEEYRNQLCDYANSIMSATTSANADITQTNVCAKFPHILQNLGESFNDEVQGIIRQSNMHSKSHTTSCYKRGNSTCRFHFPRDLVETTFLDLETMDLHIKRNNAWLNIYNPYIAYVFRCNHDLKLLASGNDTKALIYYLTEYTTKSELKSHDLFALLGAAYQDIENISHEDKARRTLIRCLNKLGTVQEQSSQLVTSYLLGFPSHYSSKHFTTLNWISILRYLENGEDTVQISREQGSEILSASNLRINYMLRGYALAGLSLYYYAAIIYTEKCTPDKNMNRTYPFDSAHPHYDTHRQKLRAKMKEVIPLLIGPPFPQKTEIEMELYSKAALLLFKPWYDITDLIEDFQSWEEALLDFQTAINFNVGNPFSLDFNLPPIREILLNLQCLNECKLSASLQQERRSEVKETEHNASEQSDSEPMPEYSETNQAEEFIYLDHLEFETPRHSKSLRSFVANGTNALATSMTLDYVLAEDTHESERFTPMDSWAETLSNKSKDIQNETVQSSRSSNSTNISAPEIIQRKFKLNAEQLAALVLVSSHVISPREKPIQLFVTGEAGTGKSQVIHAIIQLFSLMGLESQLAVTASTGTAAVKIGGATVHSLLKLRSKQLSKSSPTFRELLLKLATVKFIIIDEVSMISAGTLWKIHQQLQAIHSSDSAYGGVNMLFFGDFNQFPPVLGCSLYSSMPQVGLDTNNKCDDALGGFLWSQITYSIVLKENYRQHNDARWLQILRNILRGSPALDDFEILKSRLLRHHTINHMLPVVVNRNLLRTKLNNMIISRILQQTDHSKQYTFGALDSCNTRDITIPSTADALRQLPDNQTESLPGYIQIFPKAQYLITANINTTLGLANGTPCELYSLPENNNSEYLLVKVPHLLPVKFDGLPDSVVPIYKCTKSYTIYEGSKAIHISRTQFPLIPAYAITDYKSQGATLQHCVVDLRKPPGTSKHFHALYVMLSRVQTLNGLYVLCDFSREDIEQAPPSALLKESERVLILSNLTMLEIRQNPLFNHLRNI